MLQVRVIAPPDRRAEVDAYLGAEACVVHLVSLGEVARRPDGAVYLFEIPLESANTVLRELRRMGVHEDGAIVLATAGAVLSSAADAAVAEAPGDPTEAVVWDAVKNEVRADSRLTVTWLTLMVVSVLIAACGLFTDSALLTVGAVVVSPEYPAIVSVAVGMHTRSMAWVRHGARTLGVGFGLAIPVAIVFTLVADSLGWIRAGFHLGAGPATAFVTHPDAFSATVAVLAGIAGTVSLTHARIGTLVGVLISVTTVPAAAAIGIAIALGEWDDLGGAIAQLALNVVILIVVGAATLGVQRAVHRRLASRPVGLRTSFARR